MYRKYSDGIIEVITGPMFSGKSEELIKRIRILSYAEIPTLVIKPAIDNRFSNSDIISRNGTSIKSYSISTVDEIKKLFESNKYKALVVDEIQFFDIELINYIDQLANKGIRIIACGLDQDYLRRPFNVVAQLMAIADSVLKLKAVCLICKKAASCSFRTSSSNDTIEIGDTDKYEARCRECHMNGMNENTKQ
ncbi:MAG: thymidine kinase [Mycoplasma sp.]|nr:thymidine kinase [Mycoplasma sp.]